MWLIEEKCAVTLPSHPTYNTIQPEQPSIRGVMVQIAHGSVRFMVLGSQFGMVRFSMCYVQGKKTMVK